MFCFYCGKQNPDDSKFCLYCGKNIDCKESDSNEINSGETKSSKKNNDFNYKPLLYSDVFHQIKIVTVDGAYVFEAKFFSFMMVGNLSIGKQKIMEEYPR